MRTFFVLLRKELRGFFVSPLAWIIMTLVMIMFALSFRYSLADMQARPSQFHLLFRTFNDGEFWMVFFLLFPLLTMRLFAEEHKLGTMETLMTAPVRTVSVLLAKYFAALIFYAFLWIPTLFNFLVFDYISDSNAAFTWGSLGGAYLALLLIGAFNLAMGVFASALTSSQLIAGAIAMALVITHFLMGYLHTFVRGADNEITLAILERTQYFSTSEHLRTFCRGLIDSRPIVYYLTFSAFFLTLAHYVLERRRWQA